MIKDTWGSPVSRRREYVIGDHVVKIAGYPFPGEIRAVFTTHAGHERFVVEMRDADNACTGLLHIFNRDQIMWVNKNSS